MLFSSATTRAAALGLLWAAASSLVSAAPILTVGDGLTDETWKTTVDKGGSWLVEHYSPYCSHCKSFAPKWKELVDTYSTAAASHDFHFAQVDCVSNGDLCHSHSVKYYPSIFLYVNGEFSQEFTERRTLEELGTFVEANYPSKAEKLASEAEASVEAAKGAEEKEWSRKEEELDEQVGMGEKAVAKKTEGKQRLPTEAEEKKDEEKLVKILPLLHVADDTLSTTASTSTTTAEDAVEAPFSELLEDAEAEGENEALYPSERTTSTSTQTPPSSPTSALTSVVDHAPSFVAQQPAIRSEKAAPREAPDGTVKVLKPEEMELVKDDNAEPSFIKFFAPWCGHCKALKPKWAELAGVLSTSVHVYEVDCDDSSNKRICGNEGVKAYPTLMFYNKGASVEYTGRRTVDAMKEFAFKAMAATTIKTLESDAELQRAVQDEPVVLLFLHHASTPEETVNLAHTATKSLLGSTAEFYSSSFPSILKLFDIASDAPPTFLAFKDHSLTPYSAFPIPSASSGSSATQRLALTRQFLRTAKLPLVSELNGATYTDLMPISKEIIGSSVPPLVGLAILSRKGLGDLNDFESAKSAFEQVARGWVERRKMQGEEGTGRDVIWAWVDGDRWAGWARTMFDVKEGAKDGPKVVIADPKELTYYSSDLDGSPLALTSSAVYELIEQGIYTGKAKASSSRNAVEQFGQSIANLFSTLYHALLSHPILSVLAIVASWVLLWKLLTNASGGGSSVPSGGYQPVRGPKRE